MIQLDKKDQGIVKRLEAEWNAEGGPRVGDFVKFSNGVVERFSHRWPDGLQTSPIRGGSFHLSGASASFSGGLNPTIPLESLRCLDDSMDGDFWIFHHGEVGAHRGVYFSIPCRVFETSAPYAGFLGSSRG